MNRMSEKTHKGIITRTKFSFCSFPKIAIFMLKAEILCIADIAGVISLFRKEANEMN